jgi:hypothetical protein
MSSLVLAVALVWSLLPPPLYAKDLAAEGHQGSLQQQRACRPDVLRHCRRFMDQSDAVMADCLRANAHQLTSACREALRSAERR